MTRRSISQHRLAATRARVNALDFVVVSIGDPEIILGILDAQTVLKSDINALTILVTKTEEFTATANRPHRQIVN
jgi:hypothetical protein